MRDGYSSEGPEAVHGDGVIYVQEQGGNLKSCEVVASPNGLSCDVL